MKIKDSIIDFILPKESLQRKCVQYIYRMVKFKKNRKIFYSEIKKIGCWQAFKNSFKRTVIPNSKEYQEERYKKWIENNTISEEEIVKQKNESFIYKPLISIVTPLYNTPKEFFIDYINSIKNQTYSNWEVCLADASSNPLEFVQEIIKDEPRIKYSILKENKGISENTNVALDMANGEFIALIDHDDVIDKSALYEVVKLLNKDKQIDFIYSDEDKFEDNLDNRYFPFFKPDYSPDFFRCNNYICHFSVIRKSIIDEIGGFRKEFDGAQDYDLFLRVAEKTNKIVHIPKILYHWRVHRASTAQNIETKMYAIEAGQKALEEHCKRSGFKYSEIEILRPLGFYRIHYKLEANPLVSIIIPNKDALKYLKRAIQSILKSTYSNYEIIVVENNSESKEIFKYYEKIKLNSKIKVVQYDEKGFNYSKINNFGVKFAKGEYLILLNNDVEIITENWIEEMLSLAQRKDVGIVGAKLLYRDNTVQHAGVILGLGGIAGHINRTIKDKDPGYYGRAMTTNNYSAVTAACLMTKTSLYKELGGLDEEFKVAFNDVDYCMRVRKQDKLILYTPYAKLYHYESKSRGSDNTPEKKARFDGEIKLFENKWKKELENGDPYFNPNFDLLSEHFEIKN
jgi:GT2 family glycosyltransferase